MRQRTAEWLAKAKEFVKSRQIAYMNTFQPGNANAQAVLVDLAKFCRATQSTFHTDPRMHAVLEGRREVFLRIQKHLNLDTEALLKELNGG